ncbi:MAG: hypothetical protein SGJ18_06080 [Pseudomonadota bacterium]|nr:hypothetical protein [Pseudomonadota bacterium]
MRVACLFFSKPSNTEALRAIGEACLRFTPQVAVTYEAVFLDISRSQRLYSEESLRLRLKRISEKFKLICQIRFADDAPTALALARYNKSTKAELPLEALSDFINPFMHDDSIERVVFTLLNLGVKTIGGFLHLPRHAWAARFGALGLHLEKRVRDASDLPWPLFELPQKIIERLDFSESELSGNLETLLFFLKNVIDRAMARLRGKGEIPSCIKLKLMQEKFSHIKTPLLIYPFSFPMPQSSVLNMITIFRERLSREFAKSPLQSEVVSIELEILESIPRIQAQTNFFSKHEEKSEEWHGLIARLIEKLGETSVFKAQLQERYLPEKSWNKEFKPQWTKNFNQGEDYVRSSANPPVCIPSSIHAGVVPVVPLSLPYPERPLRLLTNPKKLDFYQGVFASDKKSWRLRNFDGPERLSGEWWNEMFSREYYRVATDTGEQLWVYKDLPTHQYYLHGYFD